MSSKWTSIVENRFLFLMKDLNYVCEYLLIRFGLHQMRSVTGLADDIKERIEEDLSRTVDRDQVLRRLKQMALEYTSAMELLRKNGYEVEDCPLKLKLKALRICPLLAEYHSAKRVVLTEHARCSECACGCHNGTLILESDDDSSGFTADKGQQEPAQRDEDTSGFVPGRIETDETQPLRKRSTRGSPSKGRAKQTRTNAPRKRRAKAFTIFSNPIRRASEELYG
ncbi:hypothetical protein NDN08_005044 [Rhodosorus marinus]|uniref:Uncharacterized protein n=1 Tax=Rhodosorus marinus TaxID=101924 RepID=A0AAV8V0I3_9RHOD|nr:hypothetical protein NDN08_005044 [Rhodosorus marinus]